MTESRKIYRNRLRENKFDKKGDKCLVRDIKNRISNSPILEFKVLENAFEIKKRGLKYFLK